MTFSLVIAVMLAVAALRQTLVLFSVVRSIRFVFGDGAARESESDYLDIEFFVVIPVLREAEILSETVAHYGPMKGAGLSNIIVVTTARESTEASSFPEYGDTVAMASTLAAGGACLHLHYPDPNGVKADQLNFVSRYLLEKGQNPIRTFVIIYDADSRPPVASLAKFRESLMQHPTASVFHQSSRFQVRGHAESSDNRTLNRIRWSLADAGALRANRFVLAYEIPRLLNRTSSISWRRQLASFVYAHVTGHGLCLRLSLLRDLPFPSRVPIEDMYYSFILGSQGIAMIPVRSLDQAEVPKSIKTQFKQLTRWFLGPARFIDYFKHAFLHRGFRTKSLAISAFAITLEWLICAMAAPLFAVSLVFGDIAIKVAVSVFIIVHATQVVVADRVMAEGCLSDRVLRYAFYPLSVVLFGIAGFVGGYQMLTGTEGRGKTERG